MFLACSQERMFKHYNTEIYCKGAKDKCVQYPELVLLQYREMWWQILDTSKKIANLSDLSCQGWAFFEVVLFLDAKDISGEAG